MSSNPLPPASPVTASVSAQAAASSDMMPPSPPPPFLSSSGSSENVPQSLNHPPTPTPTAPAPAPEQPPPVSELTMIRTHIQTLTELNNRLQTIRHIPAQLLRPPGSDPHKLELEAALLTHGFKELAAISGTVRTEKVQDALNASRKSELADPSNIVTSNIRRENLKRRRPPSPEPPQPYRETESRDTLLLPPLEHGNAPVHLQNLVAYIREHNKSGHNKLHIVAPKRERRLDCPVTIRFTAPNVVTVYMTLDTTPSNQWLVVENATAFGSREQKPPHSQSDYMAFQQLSQQLAKVLRSDPFAPLQSFVTLLSSYNRLFVDTCTNCQRVISAEGHVPPVVRKRTPPSTDPKAVLWEVRHVNCKYEPPPPNPHPTELSAADGTGADNGGTVGTV